MRHPKALDQQSADQRAAEFWAEMIWHSLAPVIKPSHELRGELRDEMATRLVKARLALAQARAQSASTRAIDEWQPLIKSLCAWRDCRIAMQMPELFISRLDVEVRAELAAELARTGALRDVNSVIFRHGHFPMFAWASKVAFFPFVDLLVARFDLMEFDDASTPEALRPTDVDRYHAWVLSISAFFAYVDKKALRRFCLVLAQEIGHALPAEGSASPQSLRAQRRQLLLRCLQAMFVWAAMVLAFQSAEILQPAKYRIAGLFCASSVSAIFNAAALHASGRDPVGVLCKRFGTDEEAAVFRHAKASTMSLSAELAALADEALDDAGSAPSTVS